MRKLVVLLLSCLLVLASIPMTVVFAEETPAFVIEQKTVEAGESVEVTVSIENNPGIINFQLLVTYDTDILELESAREGDFAGLAYGQYVTQIPYAVSWSDAIHPNNSTNGVAVILTFHIKEDAPAGKKAFVTVTYDEDNVFNSDFNNVAFDVIAGSVTVASSVPSFTLGTETDGILSTEDNSAYLSTRYEEGSDTFDLRLVMLSEETHVQVGDVVEITFERVGTDPYTITRTIADTYTQGVTMKLFTQVIAAGKTYTAAEGCVLYGAVVTGIPLEGFNTVTVTVYRDGEARVTGMATYDQVKPV